MEKINLRGRRFGRLVALHENGRRCTFVAWKCKCDCGKLKTISGAALRSGNTRSCGCLLRELSAARKLTHGLTNTPEYGVWTDINQRCSNKNRECFKHYGGRGIRVCRRWRSFENFIKDMGARPSKNHWIERVDNSKGYSPANCVWATPKAQGRNKRTNRIIKIDGERRCVADWAEKLGVKPRLIFCRIYRGWPNRMAVLTPVGRAA